MVALRPMLHARLAITALVVAASAPAAELEREPGSEWASKVHRRVLSEIATGTAEFLVVLDEQADLSAAAGARSREERGRHVFETLRREAERSQAPLRDDLRARGVPHRAFWIANMVWVRGDREDLARIARRGEVRRIAANPGISLVQPDEAAGPIGKAARSVAWNVSAIRADEVWARGHTGRGVVIGGQDTGYEWDHPALIARYRGWDGSRADHSYNWHDAVHSGGGSCGADSPEPCDDHDHGTHTMGTMVGDDRGVNQIGISPGARWIGCRNMDRGVGTPATYTECFQWFVAPTDSNGGNPDPSRAPHVINNSWACPPFEGCDSEVLRTVVEHTRAAGIVVVASAGNTGPDCGSVSFPPAIYDAVLSVAAVDQSATIASFSSRGPVLVDGSRRFKPDLSAPGVAVRSSVRESLYSSFSGTSMAAPHVAGAVALLLDARPSLAGRVEEIEEILIRSALPWPSNQSCAGDAPGDLPNHVFGHGRLDVFEAVYGDIDADGFPNLADCVHDDPEVWSAPAWARDLRLTRGDRTDLTWSPPHIAGGSTTTYDILRSTDAADFSGARCVAAGLLETTATDDLVPQGSQGSAGIFYYLVRARNDCGANLGAGTATLREAPACDSGAAHGQLRLPRRKGQRTEGQGTSRRSR